MNKRLRKNLVYNITYQILILFLPLITSSYLARIVGADGIGRYSYSYSVAMYFTYFTLLGLNKYGNRAIATVQNNIRERSKIFLEIYCMQMLCFCVSIVAYVIYLLFFSEDKLIALIQMLFVASALFDINWFFFGLEAFDKTVIRNALVKLFTTILIFILVKSSDDVWKYTIIMSGGYFISQIVMWPYLKTYLKLQKISFSGVKRHFLPNLVMFIPVVAVSIYKIMDKIMLGTMSSKAIVGYYENAEKIINVPVAIFTALGTVMLPRISAMIADNKDDSVSMYRDIAVKLVIYFSGAATFGIIAISNSLSVCMWGDGFETSGLIMSYLAMTLIFLGVGNVIRTQILIPYHYDRIYVTSVILGAIINVFVNLLLIPTYGGVGAAIGTICAEVIVCIFQLICIRKEIPITSYLSHTIISSLAGFLMLYVVRQIPNPNPTIKSIIVRVMVGGLVYILIVAFPLYRVLRKSRMERK